MSKGLKDYIGSTHELVDIKTDKDSILDSLFYENADYILTIKEGYEEKVASGQTDNLFTNYKAPGKYTSELFEAQLDQYILNLKSYISGGMSADEALTKTADISNDKVEVTRETFTDAGDFMNEHIFYYFQYLPYIFIAILVSCLCPSLLVMNKKEIKNRTNCSSISITGQTLQVTLGAIIYTFVIWLILMIAALFICGNKILTTEGLLAVINSFVFILVALAITMFISVLSKSDRTTDMIANVIGLGMSFICGVFVPQDLLGDNVLKAAHFLPAYWYVKANNMLAGVGDEVYSTGKYFSYLGIEMLFAVALFSLVLLISRMKSKSSSN
jgi:ABC-2 type transport system permease protein